LMTVSIHSSETKKDPWASPWVFASCLEDYAGLAGFHPRDYDGNRIECELAVAQHDDAS
jgi:hypothetical protein